MNKSIHGMIKNKGVGRGAGIVGGKIFKKIN